MLLHTIPVAVCINVCLDKRNRCNDCQTAFNFWPRPTKTGSVHLWVWVHISAKIKHSPSKYSWNSQGFTSMRQLWEHSELTFDLQNVISPSKRLFVRKKVFLCRYSWDEYIRRNGKDGQTTWKDKCLQPKLLPAPSTKTPNVLCSELSCLTMMSAALSCWILTNTHRKCFIWVYLARSESWLCLVQRLQSFCYSVMLCIMHQGNEGWLLEFKSGSNGWQIPQNGTFVMDKGGIVRIY